MTNEEAIEILKELWRYSKTNKYTDAEVREALELGIKLLGELQDSDTNYDVGYSCGYSDAIYDISEGW